MSGLLLTEQERQRFIAYLEQDCESSKLLYQQADKLAPTQPHWATVAKRIRQEVAANIVVLNKLRNTECVSISNG